MNKPGLLSAVLFVAVLISAHQARAQEDTTQFKFDIGADLYTSYIWRGSKLGTGPSLQPSLTFETGGLTIGVWGAFDASGYMETDPYISYSFPFGLSIGLLDYYLPGMPFFEVSDTIGSHAFEINAGYHTGGFSLSANYILNEASGIGSDGGDMYFQTGYEFRHFNIFLGAGNGWHTSNGDFAICNIGLGATKEIKITDSFSIPVNGQVILNPEKEQLFVVVGFSF